MNITLPNQNEKITLNLLKEFLKRFFNIELYNIKNEKKANVKYARKITYDKNLKRLEVIFID